MTHPMSTNSVSRKVIFVMAVVTMFVACSSPPTGAPPGTAPGTPASEDTAETLEARTPQAAGPVEIELDLGPGSFDLADPEVGLADLPSYKAVLLVKFEGTENGQPQQWSSTYVMQTEKQSGYHELAIQTTGDLPVMYPIYRAEVNGTTYEVREDASCVAAVPDPENTPDPWLEPARLLAGLIGAEEAGTDRVNEVAANRYTFDERALAQAGITKSEGEVWVATEGGYVVRYSLTTTAGADYFGEGIEGTITWNYELTDVGLPITLSLPADCPPGMVNAPLLPDASNVLNVPSILAYDTASSVADAATFYQDQLPTLGWALQDEPAITDDSAFFEYLQGEKSLTVVINPGEGGTEVQLLLGSAQP